MSASATASASPIPIHAARSSEAMGYVEDPETFFAAEKRRILDDVGDLSAIRVPLNRILIALWVRPSERHGPGSVRIIIPDKVIDEDKWQGVSALVLKMGPHCYEANDAIEYQPEDRCAVGDWVMFRRGEGFRTRIWGRECVILESERGIKMVLPRPDVVF